MAKGPTLSNVENVLNSKTTLNNNNALIEVAFQNTLSRDGSLPNNMEADLDMDSNDILNANEISAKRLLVDGVNITTTPVGDASAAADRAETAALILEGAAFGGDVEVVITADNSGRGPYTLPVSVVEGAPITVVLNRLTLQPDVDYTLTPSPSGLLLEFLEDVPTNAKCWVSYQLAITYDPESQVFPVFATRAEAVSNLPTLSDGRTFMAGGLVYVADVTSTSISDMPGFKPSGEYADIRSWPDTTTGHQEAWDYAHETGTPIVLGGDINVVGTEFWGNLTIVPGGGTINCIGDSDFAIRGDAGPRGDNGCILTRAANGNTAYGAGDDAAAKTQYLVRCEGRIPIRYTRSSTAAPKGPFTFMGLKEGSVIDFDSITDGTAITTTGAGTEATPGSFYFYNRCTVRGRYELILGNNQQLGGLWLQHVAIASSTVAEKSIFHLDGVEAINNGVDEAASVFTTGFPAGGVRGYVHATGSVTAYSSYGIAFTCLNNSLEDEEGFNVSLDTIVAYGDNLQDGNGVIKFRSCHGQLGNVRAYLEGAAAGASAGSVRGVTFEDVDNIGSKPQVANLSVIITKPLDCGDGIVDMVQGKSATIGRVETLYLPSTTIPRYSVSVGSDVEIGWADLCYGTEGAVTGLYKLVGGTVRGAIKSALHVSEDVTVLWDTDLDSNFICQNFAAVVPTSFPETGLFRFKPKIVATGTATPTRVIDSSWADVVNDIDYYLDYAGAGGAPASGDNLATSSGVIRKTLFSGTSSTTETILNGRVQDAAGTWTPDLLFAGANTGITYSSRAGSWRIANGVLLFELSVTLTSKGTSTGAAYFTLPTNLPGTGTPIATKGFGSFKNYAAMSSIVSPVARVETYFGGERLRLYTQGGGGTSALTDVNFTNTTSLSVAGMVELG